MIKILSSTFPEYPAEKCWIYFILHSKYEVLS